MHAGQVFAVSGALIAAVVAVPMNKRDMVMVTETDMAYVTVPVTTTVWVDGPDGTAASVQHYGHHRSGHRTKTVLSTVIVQPTAAPSSAAPVVPSSVETSSVSSATPASSPESSSSEYVAPTTSSVYVAATTSSASVASTTSSASVASTTSIAYVAPTTSTAYVAPTTSAVSIASTTITSEVPTTTSQAPAYTSAVSSGGSGESSGLGASGTSYSGDLTWYQTGLGSCGWDSGSSDPIVAISHIIMDSYDDAGNPNNNPMCGKMVNIVGADGSTFSAKVVDRCTACLEGDLDLSENFFNTVTENGDGRVHNMAWSFQ